MKLVWTDTVIATVDVSDDPLDLEYSPSNNNIYVVNFNSGDVTVIDGLGNSIVTTVDVGDGSNALEYNPSNNNI